MVKFAPMNIYQFRASPPDQQHAMLQQSGVFLLKKTGSGKCTTLLFQLNDFYVELLYANSFSSNGIIRCLWVREIKPYLDQIDLSSLSPLLQSQIK